MRSYNANNADLLIITMLGGIISKILALIKLEYYEFSNITLNIKKYIDIYSRIHVYEMFIQDNG